jgi:alpha-L-rhamnosidase
MYATIGGIDVDPEQPGYKHIIMRPQPGGDQTSATAELRSLYGSIRSAWTLENGTFAWHISIPANTTATVSVPVGESTHVREGDGAAEEAPGVRFLRREGSVAVYDIVAGDYHFTAS